MRFMMLMEMMLLLLVLQKMNTLVFRALLTMLLMVMWLMGTSESVTSRKHHQRRHGDQGVHLVQHQKQEHHLHQHHAPHQHQLVGATNVKSGVSVGYDGQVVNGDVDWCGYTPAASDYKTSTSDKTKGHKRCADPFGMARSAEIWNRLSLSSGVLHYA